MFILFGFGHRTIKDHDMGEEILCRRCNNKRPWQYKKITTWFTLFFIPVIPYRVEYVRVCPICGEHDKMSKEDFMSVLEDGAIINADSAYEGMTDTQANYMREMDAVKREMENDK